MAGLDVGYRLLNEAELREARDEARINSAKAMEAAVKGGVKKNPRVEDAALR